jgi:hypothetical protein
MAELGGLIEGKGFDKAEGKRKFIDISVQN